MSFFIIPISILIIYLQFFPPSIYFLNDAVLLHRRHALNDSVISFIDKMIFYKHIHFYFPNLFFLPYERFAAVLV